MFFVRFRANLYLPPFPARTFHTQLPLCPNMESTSSTLSASKKDIIRKSVTSSHHPAILRCRGRVAGRFHTRSKRPAKQRGMGDESAKSKGKPPNCTTFVDQVVPGLLTTLLSSGNTPGIDYGLLAKIQNPWRRRRTLPEGV